MPPKTSLDHLEAFGTFAYARIASGAQRCESNEIKQNLFLFAIPAHNDQGGAGRFEEASKRRQLTLSTLCDNIQQESGGLQLRPIGQRC